MPWIWGALGGVYVGALLATAFGSMLNRRGYQAFVAAALVIGFLVCLTALLMTAALEMASDGSLAVRLQVMSLAARLPDWMFHDFGPFGAGVLGVLAISLPLIISCERFSDRDFDGGRPDRSGDREATQRVEPPV